MYRLGQQLRWWPQPHLLRLQTAVKEHDVAHKNVTWTGKASAVVSSLLALYMEGGTSLYNSHVLIVVGKAKRIKGDASEMLRDRKAKEGQRNDHHVTLGNKCI